MSEPAEGVACFPTGADPRYYVRTAATEQALEALQQKVRKGRAPVVLVGPPGIGKTLLLRVAEERLGARFRVVYLPYAALPADELCTWVLSMLDQSAGGDPERQLMATSLRLEGTGSALVVMLDDAGSMPVATARRLSALLAEAEGAIRLVLALGDDSRSGPMLSSFQPEPSRIELATPMSVEETARYVRAHLVRSNAPRAVRDRFDPTSMRYLHRGSGGVPRVLSTLAGELARGNLSVLPHHRAEAREERAGFGVDPFGATCDPAAYVPRPATQELVGAVEGALRADSRAIAVTGPPGLGKTMLLRVLERRLRGGFRAVRISYTALLPEELFRWILTLLGEPVGEDPEEGLGELGRRLGDAGTTLVLLLDDANAIPVPTVRRLAELAAETEGAVRLVLFAVEDARTAGIIDALGPDAVTLRLAEPMSEHETAEYLFGRLAHARAPRALVERFDPETVGLLHEQAGGIPRELHRLAGEFVREGDEAFPAPPPVPVVTEPGARPAPERAPAPPRAAPSARLVVYGLLVIATLLAAIPLLRGGLPWSPDARTADPALAPPAAEPSQVASPSPAPEESGAPITVKIDATPWASVDVDGEYLGVTPLADVPLSPGPHVFRARMPDGSVREQRVEVGAERHEVRFGAELAPGEVELEMAAGAAPPPAREEPPEIAAEPSPAPAEEPPQIAAAEERPAPVREPEPAPPPPAPEPEPEIAAASAPPSTEAPLEIAVEASPPREPPPELPAEASLPSPEEPPAIPLEPSPPSEEEPAGVAGAREEVAAAREPEPTPPPPAPEPIAVSINATPWATIEIDGDPFGVTPMAGVLLAPGEHYFRVGMPDGTVLEEIVRIGPDNRHIAFGN